MSDFGLEDTPEIPVILSAYIVHMRRGIWLCHCSEDRDGTEGWDAFGTLAAAKRWCATYCGQQRLSWTEYAPNCWEASTEASDS
jgi:hypothetical protein